MTGFSGRVLSEPAIPEVGADLAELVGAAITDYALDRNRPVFAGYRVESILGAGGMGVAFLARATDEAPPRAERPSPGARCVLKVLLPGVVLRESKVAQLSFKKEVVALSRLAERLPPSPFVVRYLDAGLLAVRTRDATRAGVDPLLLPWCALEYVDGRPLGTTLDERLQNARGPLEPQRAAALIDGVVRGVRAVHAVGLVHRDLKPSNVLVCGEPPNELPKITDFGVARAIGIGDTFDVTVGTTGYAALEQLEGPATKGKDSVGAWSDVFALGAIIYEILGRTQMYEAPTAMAYVGKVLTRSFARLADRDDLGDAWRSNEGRALAARWDELLLRATSPRNPGGGNIGADPSMPMRHRDVEELLDDLEPLLDATRALAGRSSRPSPDGSVARVHDTTVSPRRWEWTIGPALAERHGTLGFAACRSDGTALGATPDGLVFWNGERWDDVPSRPGDDATVGVLHGGAGTFVVVRAGGEVEVLPGGGGAFSFRLPFAVKRATALTGHPLGTSFLAVHAAHGEWVVVRMHGRVGAPIARLGANAPIAAMVRATELHAAGTELLVIGGRTLDRRGDEAMLATVDGRGRVVALPPLPGRAIDALAIDADGEVIVSGPGGVGRIELDRAQLALDAIADDAPEGCVIEAVVALADGQVWGFAPGVVLRRGEARVWRVLRVEPSLVGTKVVSVAASGARVWVVHSDGRILAGRLSITPLGSERPTEA